MQKIFDWILSWPPILVAGIVFVIGMIILCIVAKIMKKSMTKTKLDVSLQGFFIKTIYILGFVVLLICALSTAGISTTGLIAGFSAAGAAVALALKDSLSNIAGGMVLLITHPFVTGDYIEMGDKEGTVQQIDIIQTTLLTNDNKTVVIPNGLLSSDNVINYTKQEKRRVDIQIGISYDSDVKAAKKSVLRAAEKEPLIINDPEPVFVRVAQYDDSCVQLKIRAWCKTEDYWTVFYNLTESIRECFDEDGITIPFNRIDVNVISK